ncbi:MAG: quinone-dependent dihydroorotate dehydrogenase [Anaerolineae bacterium]|nr:quinone-dependent dihydroorotate dehydrogenase [Anaerolineae bacterium]
MYQRLLLPFLARLDAETVHERTLSALVLAQDWAGGRLLLRLLAGRIPSRPRSLFGLTFPNILGLAAGFDKDVHVADGLARLGFGHIEVGTLTPRPQPGNPRPRIFRLPGDGAIINRMGFPNGGVAAALPRLQQLTQKQRSFVLGVSLGKQKETPLEDAAADYLTVMQAVYPYADYLAVNISSPNTPGLRELQGGDYLGYLLRELQQENVALAEKHHLAARPLLLKIAPDLDWDELDEVMAAATQHQIAALIATNTTLSRAGLTHPAQNEAGGLSGLPLRERSNAIIAYIARQTNGQLPIIGIGGIRTAADVQAKLDAGASLVQLYTGLIYEGPGIAGRILRQLAAVSR